MKIKLKSMILWTITIVWMLLIFFFSSQNGEQTAKTSGDIAQKTAEIIYVEPSEEQVQNVHLNIRTLAHIMLFSGLGILMFASISSTFAGKKQVIFLSAAILTSAYGFFDEWHKQFITGRHFDVEETILNICCGIAGAAAAMLTVWIIAYFKRPNQSNVSQ